MPKIFEECGAFGCTPIPASEFEPFINPAVIRAPDTVAAAGDLLGKPVPALPASLYREYYRTGNRSHYEGPYFARRNAIQTLLMAELTERRGRFTDLLVDYLWAVCEESTWVIPAHNSPSHGNPLNCLPDAFDLSPEDDMRHIDLFSAATGAMMAWVWFLGGEILDPVTPVIRRRILDLIRARIFHPYYTVTGGANWWMGDRGEVLNNWTPWIVSNVLTAVMLCEGDDERRAWAIDRSMTLLDRFTRTYPEDGGCDEGPGYWGVAGASYFDCAEILRDMGACDVTGHPFVAKMCGYIADFRLAGRVWANFADASHYAGADPMLAARMGRETGLAKLTAYAAQKGPSAFHRFQPGSTMYRALRNLLEDVPADPGEVPGEDGVFYPSLGVMIAKDPETGMALAAKGGHNAESHNHNDVGSFMLFRGETPIFLDPGVETYSKDTFSSKRYTLWTMRSLYHNLPALCGVEQKPGGEYRAEILSCRDRVLETELKDAYPAEAGVASFRRRVGFDGGGFFCEDRIVFRESGRADFTLMCRETPEFEGSLFRLEVAGVTVQFDPSLTPAVDAVPLEDKLQREWNTDALARVRLCSGELREKTFTVRVRV
ncbi:MAG: heparinase II/III-family protein [Clostridiales bacterium]|nr:heparinase II/III-family protein [Clostridiales bacterium]